MVTILFDDYIEAHLHTPVVIAAALIVYGIAFILIENWNKKRTPKVNTLGEITYRTAFLIGLFQVLSIIPGTSRSGSTLGRCSSACPGWRRRSLPSSWPCR